MQLTIFDQLGLYFFVNLIDMPDSVQAVYDDHLRFRRVYNITPYAIKGPCSESFGLGLMVKTAIEMLFEKMEFLTEEIHRDYLVELCFWYFMGGLGLLNQDRTVIFPYITKKKTRLCRHTAIKYRLVDLSVHNYIVCSQLFTFNVDIIKDIYKIQVENHLFKPQVSGIDLVGSAIYKAREKWDYE